MKKTSLTTLSSEEKALLNLDPIIQCALRVLKLNPSDISITDYACDYDLDPTGNYYEITRKDKDPISITSGKKTALIQNVNCYFNHLTFLLDNSFDCIVMPVLTKGLQLTIADTYTNEIITEKLVLTVSEITDCISSQLERKGKDD